MVAHSRNELMLKQPCKICYNQVIMSEELLSPPPDKSNGVILQKLQMLDQVLAELQSVGTVSVEQLEDEWRTRRAIERNLQVLVEIVIDVCQRLITLAGQSPATTGRDAVARSVQLGALTPYDAYQKMVQFRNFIVHRYEYVEVSFLVDMVNRRLPDFERFRNEVLTYVRQDHDNN